MSNETKTQPRPQKFIHRFSVGKRTVSEERLGLDVKYENSEQSAAVPQHNLYLKL
jgi:hypothetical protein